MATIEEGLAVHDRSGQRVLTPFHHGLRAEVLLALDGPRAALATLDKALAECAAPGGGFETPGLHHLRGLALDAAGRGKEAQAARKAAAALTREQFTPAPDQAPPAR